MPLYLYLMEPVVPVLPLVANEGVGGEVKSMSPQPAKEHGTGVNSQGKGVSIMFRRGVPTGWSLCGDSSDRQGTLISHNKSQVMFTLGL